jgi:hypothetical protein
MNMPHICVLPKVCIGCPRRDQRRGKRQLPLPAECASIFQNRGITKSISAISNSFTNNPVSNLTSQFQNSPLRQLGKDLTSGNLSAAQSDFATLQQAFTQAPTGSPTSTSSNPVSQAFQQLSSDLSSGNLSAAKQDYSTIQNELSNPGPGLGRNHFQHPIARTSGGQSSLLQDLNQLGQELSSSSALSGNLTAAQQAYATSAQLLGTSGEFSGLGTGLQASMVESVSDLPMSLMA